MSQIQPFTFLLILLSLTYLKWEWGLQNDNNERCYMVFLLLTLLSRVFYQIETSPLICTENDRDLRHERAHLGSIRHVNLVLCILPFKNLFTCEKVCKILYEASNLTKRSHRIIGSDKFNLSRVCFNQHHQSFLIRCSHNRSLA